MGLMIKGLICPIKLIGRDFKNVDPNYIECQSDCAWFDHEQKQCAIHSINTNLIKANEK